MFQPFLVRLARPLVMISLIFEIDFEQIILTSTKIYFINPMIGRLEPRIIQIAILIIIFVIIKNGTIKLQIQTLVQRNENVSWWCICTYGKLTILSWWLKWCRKNEISKRFFKRNSNPGIAWNNLFGCASLWQLHWIRDSQYLFHLSSFQAIYSL